MWWWQWIVMSDKISASSLSSTSSGWYSYYLFPFSRLYLPQGFQSHSLAMFSCFRLSRFCAVTMHPFNDWVTVSFFFLHDLPKKVKGSRPVVFCKKGVLKNFSFRSATLLKRGSGTGAFLSIFWIVKNSYLYRTPLLATSQRYPLCFQHCFSPHLFL